MKKYILPFKIIFLIISLLSVSAAFPQAPVPVSQAEKTLDSQWNGKRVAYLGDSMTDPNTRVTKKWYWQYLNELMGIDYVVYARSGYQWTEIFQMAQKLLAERGDSIDAIFIWAGTNDYNHSLPVGGFFTETVKETNHNGQNVVRKHRTPILADSTFCGRINKVLSFLKTNYPEKQIVILTPIHRAFARFGANNVQPDENYANGQGLFLESYIETLKKAGEIWAVPVIDLYSLSGLFPLADSHTKYFTDSETDRLHPNANGHYRIAKTLQYQLLALPSELGK